jgi:hypothetical protein
VVENVDSDGGNDGEVCIGFGDCGEEGVATVRVESLVIIVDTNAVTSCGDRRGGSDCIVEWDGWRVDFKEDGMRE